MRRILGVWSALAAAACVTTSESSKRPDEIVDVRILSFNDFHGHLLPDAKGRGGVAYLAGLIERQRTENTLVLSPGDLVGASPLVSAHLRDEPTIEVMNLVGLDFLGIGNHEFDEGYEELVRLQNGDPESGFAGSDFPFLGANIHRGDGRPIFQPYAVATFRGVRVGIIGLTLESTKRIVAPDLGDIQFANEVDTIDRYVVELQGQGVETFVVLMHEGGWQKGDENECDGLEGPILDIVERLPEAVDVVLSGHTHRSYVCDLDGIILTAGASKGRQLTQVDLRLSTATGDVVSATAKNMAVTTDAPKVAAVDELVAEYEALVQGVSGRVVGSSKTAMSKEPLETGESVLGSLIADAQRSATGADVALTNLGGIRSDLGGSGEDLTYGDLFRVQPFDNRMVVLQVTGSKLLEVLERQFTEEGEWGLFQVSSSLEYCWRDPDADGHWVVQESVRVGGETLDPRKHYTLALNSYLANKPLFAGCPKVAVHGSDVEALESFVVANSPVMPPTPGRICRADGPPTARSAAKNVKRW